MKFADELIRKNITCELEAETVRAAILLDDGKGDSFRGEDTRTIVASKTDREERRCFADRPNALGAEVILPFCVLCGEFEVLFDQFRKSKTAFQTRDNRKVSLKQTGQ